MKFSFTNYRLECTHPFGISRSSYNHYDRIFIYLEQDGLIGRGEAAPSERYNESIPQILERLRESVILPNKVQGIAEAINIFDKQFGNIKSLRAACVNAMYDWWAQKYCISVSEYIGFGINIIVPTSFTIAIGDFDELESKIAEAIDYKILKVKLGTEQDKEIISTIRNFTGKPIRVDANEGWDLETAIDMCNWLTERNVELVEQPLPENNLSDMIKLKKHSPIPLIADESCHTANDINELIESFDGINIKMSKCGGLDEALKMIDIAEDNNLKIMLGCMVESSVGITALGQVASQADYLDLDGNLLIDNDPYSGIKFKNGVPRLTKSIGIGISLRDKYSIKYPELK